VATNRSGQYDVTCTVSGGGLSGQAGAVRHGLSKALMNFEPDLRGALKRGGFLTRDPRVVERKKYGRAKARRAFPFPKRYRSVQSASFVGKIVGGGALLGVTAKAGDADTRGRVLKARRGRCRIWRVGQFGDHPR